MVMTGDSVTFVRGAATLFAAALVLMSGCGGSGSGGRRVSKSPETPPAYSAGAVEGAWIARGHIDVARGGVLPQGLTIQREWYFRRVCTGRRCRLYWTRTIDIGTFTEPVLVRGDRLTATFADEPIPCPSPDGRPVPQGRESSTFKLGLDRELGTLSGTERTYPTSAACAPIVHVIRWVARPVNNAPTRSQ